MLSRIWKFFQSQPNSSRVPYRTRPGLESLEIRTLPSGAPTILIADNIFIPFNSTNETVISGSYFDSEVRSLEGEVFFYSFEDYVSLDINTDAQTFSFSYLYAEEGTFAATVYLWDSFTEEESSKSFFIHTYTASPLSGDAVTAAPGETQTGTSGDVSATINHSDTAGGSVTIIVAELSPSAGDGAADAGEGLLATFDVRLIGDIVGADQVSVTVYLGYAISNPQLKYFNTTTDQFEAVQPVPGSLIINEANGTVTFGLDGSSIPSVLNLGGTVFAITGTVQPSPPTFGLNAFPTFNVANSGTNSTLPIPTTSFVGGSQTTTTVAPTQSSLLDAGGSTSANPENEEIGPREFFNQFFGGLDEFFDNILGEGAVGQDPMDPDAPTNGTELNDESDSPPRNDTKLDIDFPDTLPVAGRPIDSFLIDRATERDTLDAWAILAKELPATKQLDNESALWSSLAEELPADSVLAQPIADGELQAMALVLGLSGLPGETGIKKNNDSKKRKHAALNPDGTSVGERIPAFAYDMMDDLLPVFPL